MPPGNEPVTKADLNTVRAEIQGYHDLVKNEFQHLRKDVNENTEWRLEFTKENGPWRKMDKRMQAQETFSESAAGTVRRISNLFYGVLTAVLISAVIWIATAWPKLVTLLSAP